LLGEVAATLGGAGAAGWPLGLTLAVAAGSERFHARRRRTALNRALHEVRRPLQALVLADAPEPRVREAVAMTVSALGDLDREINREPSPPASCPVCIGSLVHAAVERWRSSAAACDRALTIRSHVGAARVFADPGRVGRALDNLIANALEHGTLRVELSATLGGRRARIAVADGGSSPRRRGIRDVLRRPDPRRGHGLAIVTEIAREHGGRFFWVRSERGSIAVLELPLLEPAAA
jgi:signal transduction histidine kinase